MITLSSRIQVLDQCTANLIAAGEVVERPVSVVKELIENSLDAAANKIDIYVEEGGKKIIQVSDDGSGMNKEDALLSIERYATSKIKTADDLYNLQSLGFRGEALSSIAAVSELEIITKTLDQLGGIQINALGGEIVKISPVGRSTGTTVKVKNLFYNTPARLHHQKSDSSELARISDLIGRYALAYPEISFSLTSNQKLILLTTGDNNLINTMAAIYGIEIAEKMIRFESKDEQISLSGYIGSPEIARASRHFQTIIVNGRYVKSKIISQTVERACSTFILINKYPIYILNLNLSPQKIDVNIHPTKTEIKFLDEDLLTKKVEQTIRKSLLNSSIIPGTVKVGTGFYEKEKSIYNRSSSKKNNSILKEKNSKNNENIFLKEEKQGFSEDNQQTMQLLRQQKTDLIPELILSSQIFATYWLGKDGYGNEYCIDQHAAHERVIYDRLIKQKQKGKINVQRLLIPYIYNFSPQEVILLKEVKVFLAEFGIEISSMGENAFAIRSIPLLSKDSINEQLMQNVLDKLLSWVKINSLNELVHPFCTVLSCRSAIKAGTKVDLKEFDYIWQQLRKAENPYTCPHGRPTVIKLERSYFEKKFKRT